jgi:hypothetical protein
VKQQAQMSQNEEVDQQYAQSADGELDEQNLQGNQAIAGEAGLEGAGEVTPEELMAQPASVTSDEVLELVRPGFSADVTARFAAASELLPAAKGEVARAPAAQQPAFDAHIEGAWALENGLHDALDDLVLSVVESPEGVTVDAEAAAWAVDVWDRLGTGLQIVHTEILLWQTLEATGLLAMLDPICDVAVLNLVMDLNAASKHVDKAAASLQAKYDEAVEQLAKATAKLGLDLGIEVAMLLTGLAGIKMTAVTGALVSTLASMASDVLFDGGVDAIGDQITNHKTHLSLVSAKTADAAGASEAFKEIRSKLGTAGAVLGSVISLSEIAFAHEAIEAVKKEMSSFSTVYAALTSLYEAAQPRFVELADMAKGATAAAAEAAGEAARLAHELASLASQGDGLYDIG